MTYSKDRPLFKVGDIIHVVEPYTGVYLREITDIRGSHYRTSGSGVPFHSAHLDNLIPGSLVKIVNRGLGVTLHATVTSMLYDDYNIFCICALNDGSVHQAQTSATYPQGKSQDWQCDTIYRWGPITARPKLIKTSDIII